MASFLNAHSFSKSFLSWPQQISTFDLWAFEVSQKGEKKRVVFIQHDKEIGKAGGKIAVRSPLRNVQSVEILKPPPSV